MDETEKIARICRALGVETRVRILTLLRDGPLCVGALAARLDLTQSAVSQHLRVLRDADLVSAERRGYFIHYRLNRQAIEECAGLAKHLIAGDPGPTKKAKKKGEETPCARKNRSARSRRT
jgi:DNA-binding transcriptional ArsR family regulator